ncbi:MAG: hypothetical protein HY231_00215 [Acidobacteria bacterium]|nr:hypothetical protein [Acidobacteriota bacterium]
MNCLMVYAPEAHRKFASATGTGKRQGLESRALKKRRKAYYRKSPAPIQGAKNLPDLIPVPVARVNFLPPFGAKTPEPLRDREYLMRESLPSSGAKMIEPLQTKSRASRASGAALGCEDHCLTTAQGKSMRMISLCWSA